MSAETSMQRWILTEAELAVVNPTRYPEIGALNRDELADAARRLRRLVRTNLALSRRLPLDRRATETSNPRAAVETDRLSKGQVLVAALRRVNGAIKRYEKAERRRRADAVAHAPHDWQRIGQGTEEPAASRAAFQGSEGAPSIPGPHEK